MRRGVEGGGETENEAQTSQISPAVAKQFNHIAQKFEVSYKNKIHTLAHACLCLCVRVSRSLSVSLSNLFCINEFLCLCQDRCWGCPLSRLIGTKAFVSRSKQAGHQQLPPTSVPTPGQPGQTNLNPMQPIPSLFHSSGSRPLELCVTRAGGRGDGVPALPPAAIV